MSYTPTVWETGDIVTAEKLNKLENGVKDNALPAYTSADIDKVLTVGTGSGTETLTVVPEQTLTVTQGDTYYYALVQDSIIDWASAAVGDSLALTINGQDYTANYDASSFGVPAFIALNGATPVGAIANTGVVNFLTLSSGNYTIKATKDVPNGEAKWLNLLGIKIVKAKGVGTPDVGSGTVLVPLNISWDEWDAAFAEETFMPISIYAPLADLYDSPYWSYVYGQYVLWPVTANGEEYYSDNNVTIEFDGSGDTPALLYTIGGVH